MRVINIQNNYQPLDQITYNDEGLRVDENFDE